MICYAISLKKSSVRADKASDRPVRAIRNNAPFKQNNEKNGYFNRRDYAEQVLRFCYGFVFFSLFFAIFFILNLLNAERTSAAPSYRTLSQIYLSGMRLYQVICAQMANYSHFFLLITKRILREELHHTAVKRRLLTYAQTAECHLLKSRYERSKKIFFLRWFLKMCYDAHIASQINAGGILVTYLF